MTRQRKPDSKDLAAAIDAARKPQSTATRMTVRSGPKPSDPGVTPAVRKAQDKPKAE